MLAKIEFFEVYRVLWVLEFVDTDLEDHHLQIKYFTSIKATCVSVNPSCSSVSSARDSCWQAVGPPPGTRACPCHPLGSLLEELRLELAAQSLCLSRR